MERVNLTPGRIAKATCPPDKQQAFLRDKEVPRLALRVTAGGSKSFIFESKINRRTYRTTIGDATAWTLEAARKEAGRLQQLVDQGIDPREQERELAEAKAEQQAAKQAAIQEAERRAKYTLKKLLTTYCDHLEERGKVRSAKAARSVFKCHVFEPWPDLAEAPASDLLDENVAEILRRVEKLKLRRTAGVLRSYLHAAFELAISSRLNPGTAAELMAYRVTDNPARGCKVEPTPAGDRFLSADELAQYLKALGDDVVDRALKLALYAGGQRMQQLLRAKVTDYDPAAKVLRLTDPKGRRREPRQHFLPLGPGAAAIAEQLHQAAKAAGSSFLFTSRGGKVVHLSTPGKRVKDICEGMAGEAFDLRDLRRTCETMLAQLGISRDIRSQVLSHGITGIQAAHYDRHDYLKEKRAALEKWERHLAGIVNGKQKRKVVPIR